ncbi:class I SAM-dependent DNA methyltransferase [Polyangium fumosum]|uniref:site-specific DNA-methyltransferase (adenine-specific) n=1 Tax=Polyangium fumosum TaxID=889272 RepID=A0A4U1IYB8_9BACT|nr:DNA methyltransferase [Polyangium fumosum]TKC99643.1 class I SAM-dependent DNA methyltransferase [Polyangium fumosum]
MSASTAPTQLPAGITPALRKLAERWVDAKARERANYQLYLGELCKALGVEGPRPAGSGYEYEFPVKVIDRTGKETSNFVDLFKQDHFLIEAKDKEPGRSDELMLRKAYGQARNYVAHLPGNTPPYIMVLDVARTLVVWDRWDGTFGGFGAGKRIDLPTLHEREADIALLRDIWERPQARDPRAKAQAVTEEIAEKLARLAASLETRGYPQERVSRFLMRCVFTMFAEDVRLLRDEPFRRMLDDVALPNPSEFVPAAEDLWRAMDHGKRFGSRKLLLFNGHFFQHAEALPLEHKDLVILREAAGKDWSEVEPAIFGTLLTRALDAKERHRLGAEYTPPEFIARVIRPAVEEPIRERWTAVQAEVLQLREKDTKKNRKAAEQRLRDFHVWLRSLRFLDPACGSGNFLYVTMHAVKRVEVEVLNELADVTGNRELRFQEVDPSQFYGIEVKPWAREIAELSLWIGFHQFWRRVHGEIQPEEPILRDTGTLDHRDAVLVWDDERRVPSRDRPDPTPRIPHPVTGELVPDPKAKLKYVELINAREASWPPAEFIIGNPPFLGQFRQREALGDGYVDALRAAYPHVPDSADLVVYWWYKAAKEVAEGRAFRAGLITTQSITQKQNRQVIVDAEARGARVAWAIADHYWNDGSDDARVRVAMTVIAKNPPSATLVTVDGDANVVATVEVPRLNADLTAHADVPTAAGVPLRANDGLSSPGFKLDAAGFIIDAREAKRLFQADPRNAAILKPYRNGKDFTTRPRNVFLIDFGAMDESDARGYPVLYDIVRDRVKPERDVKPDRTRRELWWRLARPREFLREALIGLPRYIVTPETSKHRIFEFLDGVTAPDNSLIVMPTADAFVLGVLSSVVHSVWALAAGSRLGIDGTPRYNKGPCFEAFPFPDPPPALRKKIAAIAEAIDTHRKAALARSEKVGMTTMYNVVDKLRAGAELSKLEREVHQLAACGTLRDLHDELDRLVAEAYGWQWPEQPAEILTRLVALHDRRVEEERAGTVRWLRPDYQKPRFAKGAGADLIAPDDDAADTAAPALAPWPSDAIGQITALRALVTAAPITVDEAARRFAGARRDIVARHLETLAILGEVQTVGPEQYASTPAR